MVRIIIEGLTFIRLLVIRGHGHDAVGNRHLALVGFVGDAMVGERKEAVSSRGLEHLLGKLFSTGRVIKFGQVKIDQIHVVH